MSESRSAREFEIINAENKDAYKKAITAYGWFYPAVEFISMLALAGLRRLGRDDEAGTTLEVDRFVPAPGQGALALEVSRDLDPDLAGHAPRRARDVRDELFLARGRGTGGGGSGGAVRHLRRLAQLLQARGLHPCRRRIAAQHASPRLAPAQAGSLRDRRQTYH